MQIKTLLTTLLASQLAFAAVIPFAEREAAKAGINPISHLPDLGSHLNPISGLPVPQAPPHQKHGRKKHKVVGAGSINPISGLPAPRVKLHVREAEPESVADRPVLAAQEQVGGRRDGKKGHCKKHGKHHNGPMAAINNGLNPINGLPVPQPPHTTHPHLTKPHPLHPQKGQGSQHRGKHHHPHKDNSDTAFHTIPGGITIYPLTPSATAHPTNTPPPPQLHPSPTATPRDRDQHHDNSQGVIGKNPSRRDVEEVAALAPEAEIPEAHDDYDEKADQLSEYEGITTTDDDEQHGEYEDFSSADSDDDGKVEGDGIFKRGPEDYGVDAEFFNAHKADLQ